MPREPMHGEARLAGGGVEDALARGIAEIEAARQADARVVVGEAGNHARDRVADRVVVGGEGRPVDAARGAEGRLGSTRAAQAKVAAGLDDTIIVAAGRRLLRLWN